jgi:uncharacterized membrane protein
VGREQKERPSKPWNLHAILAALILVVVVCIAFGVWQITRRSVVTAYFEVVKPQPVMRGHS